MAADVVKGKDLAAAVMSRTADAVATLSVRPALAVILARGDEAAAAYSRSLARAGEKTGVAVRVVELVADPTGAARVIHRLNDDPLTHGIILQKPFAGRSADLLLADEITPAKDVDGQTSTSLGLLWAGRPGFVPSTAAAALALLAAANVPLSGREAVVVGRSPVVGKPAAALLLARDATVTLCHTKTRDLAAVTRRAEILITAAGSAELVRGEMIKPGAAVVDCGYIVRDDGSVVGDVAFDEARQVASLITPAQGGVGPVTTALLLAATARAAGADIRGMAP